MSWVGKTAEGRDLSVSGTIRIGDPLFFRDHLPNTKVRPLHIPPWPDYPSIGAVQFVDPYGEKRWPSYVVLDAALTIQAEVLTLEATIDILQYLRGIVGWGWINKPPLISLIGQTVSVPGYRWGYISPSLDFVGNPVPNPAGAYSYADLGEAIGPGFTTVENINAFHRFDGTPNSDADPLSQIRKYFESSWKLHTALVWSQAFSIQNRTSAATDRVRINKRVQEIRRHWNSYNELKDARDHARRYDVKGAIRSAAAAVDASLRFYCAEWGVQLPSNQLPFDEKIERVLTAARRPSYRAANPGGATEILHLYRARNAQHEGDLYYKDTNTGAEVRPDISKANDLVDEAQKFVLWLDSQA